VKAEPVKLYFEIAALHIFSGIGYVLHARLWPTDKLVSFWSRGISEIFRACQAIFIKGDKASCPINKAGNVVGMIEINRFSNHYAVILCQI